MNLNDMKNLRVNNVAPKAVYAIGERDGWFEVFDGAGTSIVGPHPTPEAALTALNQRKPCALRLVVELMPRGGYVL